MDASPEIVSHLNILVIEDNPADARILELFLHQLDMVDGKVPVCQSLSEALDLLKNHPGFDAIISDISLPDSKGMETVEALVRARPDQAIIMQTGSNDKDLGLRAVKAGAQDFMVKGKYTSEELAKTVRYAIERRSILDRLESIQRKASIGHFTIHNDIRVVTGSAEYFRMLGLGDKSNSLKISTILNEVPALAPFFNLDPAEAGKHVEHDAEVEIKIGGRKWFAINTKLSQDGRTTSGLLQDITTRRETEEIRRQNEVAQQAAQMKEQFIASVSHEMRTPMNAILGMSNLLLDYSLGDEQRNYINSIKQSSELLLGVVNDILTISSLQNGHLPLDEKDFNLHELLANIMNIVSFKVHEKGLAFELSIDEKIPADLIGDKLRLNQILLNLIGNAIKFTDFGAIKVKIDLLARDDQKAKLTFEIADSGIGIPQDKLEAIFESFTRVKYKDRLFEGTGLGLSITKKLVEQQNGSVHATSQPGVGSTFFLTLPLKIGSSNKQAKAPYQELFTDKFDTETLFRILLAEDNKLNQIVAMKTIAKNFPNVVIDLAENGQQAIDLFLENDYQLVLMDLQMPVLDGTEAVAWIRNHAPQHKRKAFVIAMTAHAHMGEEGQAANILMDDFVLKPFEPQQLYQKISQYTQMHFEGSTSVFG